MVHITLVALSIILTPTPAAAQADDGMQACATRESSLAEMKKDENLSGLDQACLDEVTRDAKATGERSCFEDQFQDLGSVTKVLPSSGSGISGAGQDMTSAYRMAAVKNQTQKNNCDFYYNRVANTCVTTKPEAALKAFDEYAKCSDYRMRTALVSANQSSAVADDSSLKPKYQQQASMAGLAKACYLAACLLSNGADVHQGVMQGQAAQPAIEDVDTDNARPTMKAARPTVSGGRP